MSLAPVAVFTYRRPDDTARLFASLLANAESRTSRVYVFSDGPKSDADAALVRRTREIVLAAGHPRLELIERPANIGLAANIIDGVTRVCAEHGRIVVLEDDLVVARTFLRYVNDGLDRYADDERVLHISGFQYPVELTTELDALFMPFISSWGWATWSRAWRLFDPRASRHREVLGSRAMRRRFDLNGCYTFSRQLRHYLAGRVNSWAIRWYLTVFLSGGLALFPRMSLVENHGFGPDGTNCFGPTPSHTASHARDFSVTRFPDVGIDELAFRQVRGVMGADSTILVRGMRKLRRFTRRALAR